jgi:hypothetical protein
MFLQLRNMHRIVDASVCQQVELVCHFFKRLLHNARPYDGNSLFQQFSTRVTDDTIVFDKMPVMPYQSQKTPQLSDIGWNRPLIYSSNLGGICGNALRSDDMAEVFQGLLGKETLAFFNVEMMLGKNLEHKSQMLAVSFQSWIVHQDVIHENQYKFAQILTKNCIHNVLEHGGHICQTKQHHKKFI